MFWHNSGDIHGQEYQPAIINISGNKWSVFPNLDREVISDVFAAFFLRKLKSGNYGGGMDMEGNQLIGSFK
jgi:hypothetical protein